MYSHTTEQSRSSIRQNFITIGPFAYLIRIAVRYTAITVPQICLYGSVQSQQSLFITFWPSVLINASCSLLNILYPVVQGWLKLL